MKNSLFKFAHKSISGCVTLMTLCLIVLPLSAEAQRSGITIHSKNYDADILPRMSHDEAVYTMTTREGLVDLMITDDAILIQFTDRFLQKIDNEIRNERSRGDGSHLESVILSMVSTGVTTLLDRALAIPLVHIERVYYEDGKLYIIGYDGVELFDDLDIDGHYVMEDFSRRDARNFVSEAEKRIH